MLNDIFIVLWHPKVLRCAFSGCVGLTLVLPYLFFIPLELGSLRQSPISNVEKINYRLNLPNWIIWSTAGKYFIDFSGNLSVWNGTWGYETCLVGTWSKVAIYKLLRDIKCLYRKSQLQRRWIINIIFLTKNCHYVDCQFCELVFQSQLLWSLHTCEGEGGGAVGGRGCERASGTALWVKLLWGTLNAIIARCFHSEPHSSRASNTYIIVSLESMCCICPLFKW